MKLIILSGRSGSGKSVALKALEDSGYYCIDNLPLGITLDVLNDHLSGTNAVAISVDARNPSGLAGFSKKIANIKKSHPNAKVVFVDAQDNILMKRFSETRRRHPLTNLGLSLNDAMDKEERLLSPIRATADLVINTSGLTPHELREQIRVRVTSAEEYKMDIMFTSFGFKHGAPHDTDFILDARCLPNPHWVEELRPFTGCDAPIQEYLSAQNQVTEYLWQLQIFLDTWLPEFSKQERSYLTFAVGCTGGKHRSVYIIEKLHQHFSKVYPQIRLHHRELGITR